MWQLQVSNEQSAHTDGLPTGGEQNSCRAHRIYIVNAHHITQMEVVCTAVTSRRVSGRYGFPLWLMGGDVPVAQVGAR